MCIKNIAYILCLIFYFTFFIELIYIIHYRYIYKNINLIACHVSVQR